MKAPSRGKVHSLNDHRPALKVGEGVGLRQVRDPRMRTRVLLQFEGGSDRVG